LHILSEVRKEDKILSLVAIGNDDSNEKILVLALSCGRMYTEHVDVMRKITEFYYRKGGKGFHVGSLSG
jgi:hypothetical protein